MENKNKTAISIFGSCVTRDVFEIDKEQAECFDIKTYIARQTVVSSLSKPVRCSDDDIVLESAFQKRMVLSDLRKTAFSQFFKDGSKYLVIDLIDERLGMLNIGDTIVTQSNELINSGYTKDIDTTRVRITKSGEEYMIGRKSLSDYCRKFCRKLKLLYPQKNIIIHRALGVDTYYDADRKLNSFPEDQANKCHVMNQQLNYMYDALERYLPKAHVISADCRYCGDSEHKWGLAIVHYEQDYYRFVLSELRRIVGVL